MTVCASAEAKRVDDELNRVYKLLLSKVRGNPVATAKIRAAQRAWVAYRDTYIEAMYPAKDKQAEYGSMFHGSQSAHCQAYAATDLRAARHTAGKRA